MKAELKTKSVTITGTRNGKLLTKEYQVSYNGDNVWVRKCYGTTGYYKKDEKTITTYSRKLLIDNVTGLENL